MINLYSIEHPERERERERDKEIESSRLQHTYEDTILDNILPAEYYINLQLFTEWFV